MMLVQTLRLYLEQQSVEHTGWFAALADPQISVALGAIHANAGHDWKVEELASKVGMSRTVGLRCSSVLRGYRDGPRRAGLMPSR
jgi:AraC-like DNA-binding protein